MSIQNFETGGKVTARVQPIEEIRALLEDDKKVSYLVPQLLVDGGLGRVGAFSDVHVDFESAKLVTRLFLISYQSSNNCGGKAIS